MASPPELQKKTRSANEFATIFSATSICGPLANRLETCHSLLGLLFEGGHHAGVRMPERDGGDAAHQVEVATARGVVEVAVFTAHDGQRRATVVADQHVAAAFDEGGVGVAHGGSSGSKDRGA